MQLPCCRVAQGCRCRRAAGAAAARAQETLIDQQAGEVPLVALLVPAEVANHLCVALFGRVSSRVTWTEFDDSLATRTKTPKESPRDPRLF